MKTFVGEDEKESQHGPKTQSVAVNYTMKQRRSSLTFKSSSRDKVELGSLSSHGLIYSCSLLKDSQMRTTERP